MNTMPNLTDGKIADTVLQFESWDALIQHTHKPLAPANSYDPYSQLTDVSKWSGTTTYAEAEAISINGDAADLARVKAMAEGLEGRFTRGARDTSGMVMQWDYAGEMVDMDRYLTGDPENMIRFEPDDRLAKGKIVSIAVSIRQPSNAKTDAIRRRGAAVVALIDLLEQTGRRVELNVVCGIETSAHTLVYSCIIKRADESVDMTRLCYCLINPAAFRRHTFRVMETVDFPWTGYSYGYGNETAETKLAETRGPVDLFISGQNANDIGGSDYSARQWLETELKRITESE